MSIDNVQLLEIGKRIFERRRQISMTQEKLSELTDTTPQAISYYERGEREMKAKTIIKIAEALDITTDYLLTGKTNAFSPSAAAALSELTDDTAVIINDIVEKCIYLSEK